MKKNKEKEERTEKIKKITNVGCPSFDNMTKQEQQSSFSTLLVFITEYYKGNGQKIENK